MKCLIYVRVSTEEQKVKGLSIENQVRECKLYAQSHNIDITEVISDAGYSAKSLDRPGIKNIIEKLINKEVDGIVIFALDRLTRNIGDLNSLINRFFLTDCHLFSVKLEIDTRSASGRLVLNLLITVAQWEREIIGERTKAILQHKKKSGYRLGKPPYGYDLVDGKLIKNSDYDTVLRMKKLRRKGTSYGEIARFLNHEKIPSPQNRTWHSQSVKQVIQFKAK